MSARSTGRAAATVTVPLGRSTVTEEISAVDGVDSVTVDLPTGTVHVTATRPVDRADIAAAVDEAGYELIP